MAEKINYLQIYRDVLRKSPTMVIITLLFLFFIGLVLSLLVGKIIAVAGGMSTEAFRSMTQGNAGLISEYGGIFRLAQAAALILGFGLPAWLIGKQLGNASRELNLNRWPAAIFIGAGVLLMIMAIPLVLGLTIDAESFHFPDWMEKLGDSLKAMEVQAQTSLQIVLVVKSPLLLVANILAFALVPAICEELFFRGVIQNQLSKKINIHLAIWITGFIFSFFHFQFFGFFPRLILGAILGYLFYSSGSLWTSIAAHFFFNLISIVAAFSTANNGVELEGLIEGQTNIPLWVIAASALAISTGIYLLLKKRKDIYTNE